MSGGDTQQTPPPQPPPRTGSPFGRFLTSPVLLVGLVALAVGFATFRSAGDGGDDGEAGSEQVGIAGSWEALAGDTRDRRAVSLEVGRFGGTLTSGRCTGKLTPRETESDEWVFTYRDESGVRGCPRRMRVRVSLVDPDTLRLETRRPGRPYRSTTLRRS